MIINEYQVYCETEGLYITKWSESEPVTCPNSNAHQIDQERTAILRKLASNVQKVEIVGSLYHDGRPSFHNTPRPDGMTTWHSGRGDLPDGLDIGSGPLIWVDHSPGAGEDHGDEFLHHHQYVDFNTVLNPSAFFTCNIVYTNMNMALVSGSVVTSVTPTTPGTSTYFRTVPFKSGINTYHGDTFIIPANGDGNVLVNPSTCKPVQVLVKNGVKAGPGFWNFDFDKQTGTFLNMRPAPNGDGYWNLFAKEITLLEFVNDRILAQSSNAYIDSKDSDLIPHGVRLLVTLRIRKTLDTACSIGITLMMYRTHTVP